MDVIDGMRCFAAVVERRSFTGAARALGLRTNLVSKYVRQLEERLEVRLLNRTTRSLSLTEAGQAYFSRCLSLLEEFDELEAAVQDRHASLKGTLRVTAPNSLGVEMLMRAVTGFMMANPGLSIDLRLTDRFINIVDEGYDLAIRVGGLKDSSLIARRLGPVPSHLCASPAYLERHGTPLSPEDLTGHTCLIDSNFSGGTLWPFTVEGEQLQVNVKGRIRVNSVIAVREAALMGAGIALMPGYEVADDIEKGKLVSLLEDHMTGELAMFAVYPHSRHLAAKSRAFTDYLAAFFAAKAA